MVSKIAVLTSGGDAPGMNAAIRAVVRSAIASNSTVFAIEGGYAGLINQQIRPLNQASVANCIQRGGTILKSGRCLEFLRPEIRRDCVQFLNQQGFDGLIVLGGNGSFQGAQKITTEGGPPSIGIPCTIDNDIPGTDYCIGFDTACNTAVEAIDKIRDTAFSLDRNFMIEVMGRASGFIAVEVGIAGGAELIIIPEFKTTTDQIIEKLSHKYREKMASIIVVAEGGHTGHSMDLAKEILERTGISYTVCILGHIQRGGRPSVLDRKIASMMGVKAVQALLQNLSCKMIAMLNGDLQINSFPPEHESTRYFDDQELLALNRIICDIN